MVLLSIDSLKCPEWDLSEDFLSEGVETQKPMEISSLPKNMEEYRANKIIMSTTRIQRKTLKQDISDMLRTIANRKKYFKDNKIKATLVKKYFYCIIDKHFKL